MPTISTLFRAALSVNMSKTVIPWMCSVEGESGSESDERIGQALGGSAIEVVAKTTRRRSPVEYKRKIVREADACKTPGAVGALLRREELYFSHLTTWRAARERGELAGPGAKKRSPVARVPDPRDKRIADLERESLPWQRRAERAEARVGLTGESGPT